MIIVYVKARNVQFETAKKPKEGTGSSWDMKGINLVVKV